MKLTFIKPFAFSLIIATSLTACKSGGDEEQNLIDEEVFDPNSSLNTVFDGKIFSIPSPIQTASFIRELGLPFDESLLNDNSKINEYVTEYQQALNLGIYGADLGYTSMYEQKGTSMRYLSSVEKLTSQLGLNAAFDSSFLMRFEKNNGNEDSMIVIMSDAFREADNFLKTSNRKSTSALVLTGGWIESLYFACELNAKKSSSDILRRIGEQKESLNSILGILTEYNKSGSNDELIDQMESLKISFEKINVDYNYAAPETDKEDHLTTFHHTLNVEVSNAVVEEVRTKVKEIRANIIKG